MTSHPGDPADLTGLTTSTRALTRTVDTLTEEDLATPSLLPGWTRGHVIAHVVLNGETLTRVLDGVVHDRPVAMYESDAQRDSDIDELATAAPSELRDRHLASTATFAEAVGRLEGRHWDGRIDRLPGGPAWPVLTVVQLRRREVEIHHADLGAHYSWADWPTDFVVELLDAATEDHAASGPFAVRALDLDRSWRVGGAPATVTSPTVSGTGADLGWWLTGRGGGQGLTCDAGTLPALGPWRRTALPPVTNPGFPARP